MRTRSLQQKLLQENKSENTQRIIKAIEKLLKILLYQFLMTCRQVQD